MGRAERVRADPPTTHPRGVDFFLHFFFLRGKPEAVLGLHPRQCERRARRRQSGSLGTCAQASAALDSYDILREVAGWKVKVNHRRVREPFVVRAQRLPTTSHCRQRSTSVRQRAPRRELPNRVASHSQTTRRCELADQYYPRSAAKHDCSLGPFVSTASATCASSQ